MDVGQSGGADLVSDLSFDVNQTSQARWFERSILGRVPSDVDPGTQH
jgi:hypothetical protein